MISNRIECKKILPNSNFVGQKPFVANWFFEKLTLFKVCGDIKDTELMNSEENLTTINPDFSELLGIIFRNFGLIICGWSAKYDIALRDLIRNSYSSNTSYDNYWIDKYELNDESKKLATDLGFKQIIMDGNDFFCQLEESVKRISTEPFENNKDEQMHIKQNSQTNIIISDVKVIVNHDATEHVNAEYQISFNYICPNGERLLEYLDVDFRTESRISLQKDLIKFKRVDKGNILLYPGYYYYGYGGSVSQRVKFMTKNRIRVFFPRWLKIEQSGTLKLVLTTNCQLVNSSKSGLYRLSIKANDAGEEKFSEPYEIRDTIHFVRNNPIIFTNNNICMCDEMEIRLVNNKIRLVNDIDTITIAFPIGFTIPENIDNNSISVSKHNFLQCLLKRIGFRNISKWYKIKIKPTVNGNLLTITLPMTIKECEKFDIRFDKSSGIKNPQTSCYYTIQVKTSAQNWYAVSPPFPIS